MKFAENNRISHRQLYRQMVLAFTAPFLLCLFGDGKTMGMSGIWGTVTAVLVLLFYVIFLIRQGCHYSDLCKAFGGVAGRLVGVFFVAYVILTGAYLLGILAEIVPKSLVSGVSGKWISFFAVLTCSMGIHKGMQRRGRLAEVSGGLLLGSVVLLMLLSIRQGKMSYLREMWDGSVVTGKGFLSDTYGVICAFAGIGLLPFALTHVEKQGSAGKSVALGIGTLGGILVGMEVLLPAVFGWERVQNLKYPMLPLLAGADLPGNVLARFDVLWMGFLLYSLLFAIGSLLHYGHQIMGCAGLGSGRFWMAAVIYGLSVWETSGVGIGAYYGKFLGYVFVPGMILIQVCLFFGGRGKWKKKVTAAGGAAGMLCLLVSLTGCGGVEPEKRMYPLALGVESTDAGFSVDYGMPDLPKATGQEKSGQNEGGTSLVIRGKDFAEIEKLYNESQEKYLDMGHLQVLILGEKLVDDGKWSTLLSYLEEEPFVGENVYVFETADVGEVMKWQGDKGTSIGEYLQGLLENRTGGQQEKGVTLRQLYHRMYEDGVMPELPEIRLAEPSVENEAKNGMDDVVENEAGTGEISGAEVKSETGTAGQEEKKRRNEIKVIFPWV